MVESIKKKSHLNKSQSLFFVLMTFAAVCCLDLYFPCFSYCSNHRGLKEVIIKDKSGKQVSLYSESHALVIGASNYTAGWPKLESVPHDVTQIAAALKKNNFHVEKVINPTSRQLKTAFENFINKYGFNKDNRLVFFFAGHGHSRKNGKKGYLVPVDAPNYKDDEIGFLQKSLEMGQILAWAKIIEAKHALFVFDSCFSGTIFKTRALPIYPPHISDITSKPVRQFISAGSAGETVPAESVFAPSFIRALRGEGDLDKDGYITGTEMGMYIHRKVLEYETGQHPQYGKIRDPNLDEGDFVFIVTSSDAIVDSSTYSSKHKKTTLTVKSNITGSKIYIDGELAGTTNLSGLKIEPGEHTIKIAKKGYEVYSKHIQVKDGQAKSLRAFLKQAPVPNGSLSILTVPENSSIRLLDFASKFEQDMELKPGRYNIEVSAYGYETKKVWITIGAGEDKALNINLLKMAGTGEPSFSTEPDKIITSSLGMKFVYIKPGSFIMGSPSSEVDREENEIQHKVVLTKGFYIQTTEVTQGQWKSVMENNPSHFKYCGDDCPVENVSWYNVQDFIKKLNKDEGQNIYRLPTEAEWEYACRAGSTSGFSFGNDGTKLGSYAWYFGNSESKESKPPSNLSFKAKLAWRLVNLESKTHPTAKKKPNIWGLHDMHGNVREWCQDWKGNYSSKRITNPTGPSDGTTRVCRGGSWVVNAAYCRSAYRFDYAPEYKYNGLGFRLVRISANVESTNKENDKAVKQAVGKLNTATGNTNTPSLKFVNTRQSSTGETARIHLQIKDNGSGVGDVHVFINGSEIYAAERAIERKNTDSTFIKSYTIKAQRGLNEVKAYVYDKNNEIKSEIAHFSLVGDYKLSSKPMLYAVVIGIDSYKNKKFDLTNAEADANLFGTTLYKHAKDIFQKVNIKYLRKEQGTTKEAISRELKKLQNISPNDFFVFYSASHGIVVDNVFYLVSSNVSSLSSQSVKNEAISQEELLELFKRIPTANKLILFDTCYSGLINTKISKKLVELSVQKLNVTSISATQSQQRAIEGYADGHGVFTYVLSDALEGDADFNNDGVIQSMELVSHAKKHVPVAAQKHNHIQHPESFQSGQVFPITKHKRYNGRVDTKPQYFTEDEVKKLTTYIETNNIASFNNIVKKNEIDTKQKVRQLKKEAEKSEAKIVENEFNTTDQHFDVDRIKFIFHDDSVFLAITDKIKEHFIFTDEQGHKLLVLDVYSTEFTKHSVNYINTSKFSKIDIGWHETFYRVTLHLKKESTYNFIQTERGIYIKIRNK